MAEKWTQEKEDAIREVDDVAKDTGSSYSEAKEARDQQRKDESDDEQLKKSGRN
jgi:hypothetical protein